jgi:hypothetical protein
MTRIHLTPEGATLTPLPGRLRENAEHMKNLDRDYSQSHPLLLEAADEIERLRSILMWIDTAEPETVAAAETKFGKIER